MTNRNPWLGLATYDEQSIREGYKFCGRERATKELYSIVDNNICTTLYGKSGIGKSSLLQAGLFPRLRTANYFPVMIRLGIGETKQAYSSTIISAIKSAIEEAGGSHIATADGSGTAEEQLKSFFRTTEFRDSSGEIIFPIIVLDQFEELYFRDRAPLNTLLKAIYLLVDDNATDANGEEEIINYRIVISIREDDLFHLEESIDKLRLTEMKSNRYRLRELSDEEARNVITQPAGTLLAPDEREQIAATIIKEAKAGSEEISTAILSLICSRIYDSTTDKAARTQQQVTTFFKAAEGNFLKSFYDDIIKELHSPAKWYYIEDALVTDEGRRNSVPKSEFERRIPDAPFLFRGEKSMLRYVTLPGNDEPRVEIIHDTLARQMLSSKTERKLQQQAAALRRQRLTAIAIIVVIVAIGAAFFMQYRSIVNERNNMYKMQTHYITEKAEKLVNEGDVIKAIRLLINVLPQKADCSDRPNVIETEFLLRNLDNQITHEYISDLYTISSYEDYTMYRDSRFAISPRCKYIAAAMGKEIKILNLEDGTPHITINSNDKVESLDFSNNDKSILVGHGSGKITIWSTETGNQIKTIIHHDSISEPIIARFSNDGKFIATAAIYNTQYNSIKIWDSNTYKLIKDIRVLNGFNVKYIEFSPDGNYLATISEIDYSESNIKIYNTKTWKQIGNTINNHQRYASVKFDNTGKYHLTTHENAIKIWETKTGKLFRELTIESFDARNAQFTPNGRYVYMPRLGQFWDFKNNKSYIDYDMRDYRLLDDLKLSKNWEYVIATDSREINKIYRRIITVKKRNKENKPHINNYRKIYDHQISPDDKHFITVSEDSTLRIWDANGKQLGDSMKHHGIVFKANYSHDGKYIVTHSDSILYIWNAETNKNINKLHFDKALLSAKFATDDKSIITATDSVIYIYNIDNGTKESINVNKGIRTASFSPDGKNIISSTSDSTIIIVDLESGNIINKLPKQNSVATTAEFSPNGEYIITESGGITKLWDTRTYTQVGDSIERKHNWSYIRFSTDSKYFIISNDGKPYVYNTETAKIVLEVTNKNQYNYAKLSNDGKSILLLGGHKINRIEFPMLQELIEKYKKLFKDWPLTEEELREYNFK